MLLAPENYIRVPGLLPGAVAKASFLRRQLPVPLVASWW